MSTTARLDRDQLELVAGIDATCELTVVNHSPIVEGYDLQAVGDLAPWIVIEPATLSLYPETETTATVRIATPESAAIPAGPTPFGIVVQPRERPNDRVTAEAIADVARRSQLTIELSPTTTESRFRSKHSLAVDNRGNHAVDVAVDVSDPDDQLAIKYRPDEVAIAPGAAAFVPIRTGHRRLLWRGQGAMKPFQVTATPRGEGQPVLTTGRVMQEAILTVKLAKPLALVCAAVLALAALWFGLLRPTVESTAEDAVAEPVAEAKGAQEAAEAAGADVSENAGAADKSAEEAKQAAKQAQAPPKTSATPSPKPTPKPPATTHDPFNRRMTVTAAAGSTLTAEYVVPDRQTISVTDLVFQSIGDEGTVAFLRNDDVLITAQPQDFRTLDQHFVSPFVYTAGQRMVLELTCRAPAQGSDECSTALYVGGEVERRAPAHTGG